VTQPAKKPADKPAVNPAGKSASGSTRTPVRELSETQCWKLLSEAHVGTLALVTAEGPDLYPIDFLATAHTIVFRSAPGEKLRQLTADPRVALAVEGGDQKTWWSVIVHGTARRLAADDEIEATGVLALETSFGGTKANFVRITPARITGRRFTPRA